MLLILNQNKINIDLNNLDPNQLNLSKDTDKIVCNNNIEFYDPKSYEKMGRQLLVSVLDYEELNPFSKVFSSEFQNVFNLRKYISIKLSQEDPRFKNNNLIQNLIKNINFVKTFQSTFEKLSLKKEGKSNNSFSTFRNQENKLPLEGEIHLFKHLSGRESRQSKIKGNTNSNLINPLATQKNEEKTKTGGSLLNRNICINDDNFDYIIKQDNYYIKKNHVNLQLKKSDNNTENLKVEQNRLPILKNINDQQILKNRRLISANKFKSGNNSFSSNKELGINFNYDNLVLSINQKTKESKKQNNEKVGFSFKNLPNINIKKKFENSKNNKEEINKMNSLHRNK